MSESSRLRAAARHAAHRAARLGRTLGLVLMLLCGALPVAAQETPPPPADEGLRHVEEREMQRQVASADALPPAAPEAVEASDPFGYVVQSAAIAWIDARGGTPLPFDGMSRDVDAVRVDLPFAFKLYEGSYTSAWVSPGGFLTFGAPPAQGEYPRAPSPVPPNGAVAAYASRFTLRPSGQFGRVFVLAGGAAPNRFYVVEWNSVRGPDEDDTDDLYTFQIVLHENGDMRFQYQRMETATSRYCGYGFVESPTGGMGLKVLQPSCSTVASGTAYRIVRPAVGARAALYPQTVGGFVQAGRQESFPFTLVNAGGTGAQRFQVTVQSAWPAVVSGPRGALTDTDGDGVIDTGPMSALQSIDLFVTVHAPAVAAAGESNEAVVAVRPVGNLVARKEVVVRTAIPLPFLAALWDRNHGRVSQYDLRPDLRTEPVELKTSGTPLNLTLTAMPGLGALWLHSEDTGEHEELFATVVGASGSAIGAPLSLFPQPTSNYSYLNGIAAATTPDGRMGVTWLQTEGLWDAGPRMWKYRSNVWFAPLAANGSLAAAPARLTQNDIWLPSIDYARRYYWGLAMAATGDGRFVMAWNEYHRNNSGAYQDNIEYAVRSAGGAAVRGVTLLSSRAEWGQDLSWEITLAPYGPAGVAFVYRGSDTFMGAIGSSGAVSSEPAHFMDCCGWDYELGELAGGRLLVVRGQQNAQASELGYQVFGSPAGGPVTALQRVPALVPWGDPGPAGVLRGAGDGALIVWGQFSGGQFGVMEVGGDGAVRMKPLPFAALTPEQMGERHLWYVWDSFRTLVTASHLTSSAGSADLRLTTAPEAGGPQGGQVVLQMEVRNRGAAAAQTPELTVSLPASLTVTGGVPEPASVASSGAGSEVTWLLPTLGYLDGGTVTLLARLPESAVGASFPVTATLQTVSPVFDPAAGNAEVTVQVRHGIWLPTMSSD